MSYNLVSANNLAVNNNLTVNGTITGSNNISTTSNIQGANITATSNINANNVNLTGQLNSLTLNNLNSLDTTSSIQSALNNLTGNVTSLQTKISPFTFNSPNLGIFNTSPSYPLDVTASTYRIGPVAQINSNGTFALVNTSCASDNANFCLYQGVLGDTVLNCGLNETIEFKVHNSQVAMLNSTGIGIGNGNPQHALDVTGSINASTDLLINGNSISPALSTINSLITIKAYGVVNYNGNGNGFSFGSSNNLQLTGNYQCILGSSTGTHYIKLSSGVSGSLLQITLLYNNNIQYDGLVALYSTNQVLNVLNGNPPVATEETFDFKITTFSNSSYNLVNCGFSFIVI